MGSETKIFLVFNTACFGDVLVCNSLVQNIKLAYPNSKVVFVCDKNFYEAAKYQKDVDEVAIYDKRGIHKGLDGFFRFIKTFAYKNPYAAFITYPNMRNYFAAKLLGCKYVVEGKNFRKSNLSTQEQHTNLLTKITKQEIKNLPIEFVVENNIPEHLQSLINKNEKYIGLCALTKNPPKDMPIETAIDLIKKINQSASFKVILFGVGKNNRDYAEQLRLAGCDFVDLVNKTSIYELAQVLKVCKALVSVDTGTMHLGYAVKTPVVSVFYEKITLNNWAPNPELYKAITISENQAGSNVYDKILELIGE